MKQILIFTFFLFGFNTFGQNELENVYLSKSEMHGGTESSGVSTTMAYTYVSKKAIKMLHITLLDDEPLMLTAKDTLIIYFISHRPGGRIGGDNQDEIEEHKDKTSFKCYYRNGAYHVSVNTESEFIQAANYRYKKKKFVAKRKTKIDSGQSHYAP
jgi:hypothetical protein